MTLSRRRTLALLGGGSILAATVATGYSVTRLPGTAFEPWAAAGTYTEPRMRAPEGGTVQMLGRLGYGTPVPHSPRWPLESKIVNA